MTTKDDKIKRQKDLLNSLNNDTFDRQTFLKKHNILDRTLRRDLNDLSEQGSLFKDRLNYLRRKCLGKLTKKVNDDQLSDSMMLQIVLSGEAQKQEIKADANVNISGLYEGVQTLIKFSQQPDDSDGS